LVTLALGLATAEAITNVANAAPDLRWPNDVLLNGRKCAGILVQLHDGVLTAGIGINVNHTSFPEELAMTATSLRLATGREYNLETLLTALIGTIDEHLENLLRNGRESVLRAFAHASSFVRGRRVVVDQNGRDLTGVTDGLDPQGFLLIRKDDGTRTVVLAGGVRPA
jgi:BirA family biotin operon repressor/biotin-[acetyl-CoA-carboxylase] ligase